MGSVLIGLVYHPVHECPTCKVMHSVPPALYESALASRNGNNRIGVSCPYGHQWWFTPKKELDEQERVRQERDRLRQKLAEKDDEIAAERDKKNTARHQARAFKGQVTKIKNRVGNGVCPCCNRHFTDLERHMASKHKNFSAEAVAS